MSFGRDFIQKNWRDAWDLDTGGWKKGSWYPGRNISRWMDKWDKSDIYNVSTEYDAPEDYNPELTSLAGEHETDISSQMYHGFQEGGDTGFKDDFTSNITAFPTQEGISQAQLENPNLTGGVYGLSMKDSELTQDDPYNPGGQQYSYMDETAFTDLEGNPIYGPSTGTIQSDRWYPGKGAKGLLQMITGKRGWGNPFTYSETFDQ
tara:strand:- start:1742 stop:2356 length:615 start_codon:yes stop_codon:yes gene_type:complete